MNAISELSHLLPLRHLAVSYPLRLSLRAMDKFLLCLAGDRTLEELFGGSFKAVLSAIVEDAPQSVEFELDVPREAIRAALRDLAAVLPEDVSLRHLMERPRAEWPAGVDDASRVLKDLGFMLPHNHVPEAKKGKVEFLFARRKFLEELGGYSLRQLFTIAKADVSPRKRHIVHIARDAGVLRRHSADPWQMQDPVIAGDKNDRCCGRLSISDPIECLEEEDSYCQMDTSANPPNCNMMSEACYYYS